VILPQGVFFLRKKMDMTKNITIRNLVLFPLALIICLATPSYALDVILSWDANKEGDLDSYKIYYDTDPGNPYNGDGAFEGDSPIRISLDEDEDPDPNIVQYALHSLPDGVYFFALTATNLQGSESGYSNEVSAAFQPDQSPIADTGPDQVVEEGLTVTLSGLNSTDPDGEIVSYHWEQPVGTPVVLSDPWAPETLFTSPDVSVDGESLSFQLTVIDDYGLASSDTCIVNVVWVNEPPVAEAGSDQTVFGGEEVVLDASMSSDADDGIATYFWEQTGGPSVSLSGADSMQAFFIAPDVGDSGEALTFALTITDNGGLKAVDTCVVNVEGWINLPPVADAGPDQEVYEQDMVTLDGSGSTDPDGGISSYLWTQTAGTPVTLSDTLATTPTFTAPSVETDGAVLGFELTTTDQGGLKSTDNCSVVVNQDPWAHSLVDLWVDSLTVSLQRRHSNYRANAYVMVLDETHNPVRGATVTATWTFNGKNSHVTSGVTDRKGVAQLDSSPERAALGDIFTVAVTSIAKEGYTYDPASNRKTTVSVIVP
jgi:hypothetical protein